MMEALTYGTIAAKVAQRSYRVARLCYRSASKPIGPIVIEITSADGKTSSKETIAPATTFLPSNISAAITSSLDTLSYHLQTIVLFTYSDARTVLIPWVLFGVGHAMSASVFDMSPAPSLARLLINLPKVAIWLYVNLLPFCISNQSSPSSILEDADNKPWRPLPSKRLTATAAQYLMLASYVVALLFSLRFGGTAQCIFIAMGGYAYNDMGGGDKSWFMRHLLNGIAFITFGSGAMEVALGRTVVYSPVLVQWLRIIVLIIFSGIHAADIYDQKGDAAMQRRTLPLVIGDEASRWILAISVLAWSIACPTYWSLGPLGYALPGLAGLVVAKRTLTFREPEQDRQTYKLWNVWLVAIYCLPLIKMAGMTLGVPSYFM